MLSPLVIMQTCPYSEYPLTPHFYIVKLGFTGVYIIFLFLLLNTDCGYSLEPPQCVPTIYVLSKNKKNIKIFHLKVISFTVFKNCSILHGNVCVKSELTGYLCVLFVLCLL